MHYRMFRSWFSPAPKAIAPAKRRQVRPMLNDLEDRTLMAGGLADLAQRFGINIPAVLNSLNTKTNTGAGVRITVPQRIGNAFTRPTSTPAPAVKLTLSPAQQANVDKLINDVITIAPGKNVTTQQTAALRNAVTAILDGAKLPDPALVTQLQTTYQTANADGNISFTEQLALLADGQAVLVSANIPMSEIQTFITAAKDVVNVSQIDNADIQTIITDVTAILNEAKTNPRTTAPAPVTRLPIRIAPPRRIR